MIPTFSAPAAIAHHRFHRRTLAALLAGALLIAPGPVRAADSTSERLNALERELQAERAARLKLERELNMLNHDDKGKNLEAVEPPVYMQAAGEQVKKLTISGDLRLRYEYSNRDPEGYNAGTGLQKRDIGNVPSSAYRYRLRLDATYEFRDNWSAGFGIISTPGADANDRTLSGGFDNYSIYLNLWYLDWKINQHAAVSVGKIVAPFYSNTDTLVDFSDIRPAGLTERFNFEVTPQFSIAVNLGQYVFYDNPENGLTVSSVGTAVAGPNGTTFVRTAGGNRSFLTGPNGSSGRDNDLSTDAILMYQEAVFTWKPNNDAKLVVAPAFYFYPNNGSAGVTGTTNTATGTALPIRSGSAANDASLSGTLENVSAFNDADATRNLFVGLLGGEFNYRVPMGGRDVNLKLFGDLAYNFTGGARMYKQYALAEDSFVDKSALVAGAQFGELKKKGDWYVSGQYAYTGVGSIDPNLNDPYFGLSRLNQQGFRLALGYNLYSWLKAEVIYYNTWNLEKNLHNVFDPDRGFAGGNALLRNANGALTAPRLGIADTNASQLLQVQVTATF